MKNIKNLKKYLFQIIVSVVLVILSAFCFLLYKQNESIQRYLLSTQHIDLYQDWRLDCLESEDKTAQKCKEVEQIKGYPVNIPRE